MTQQQKENLAKQRGANADDKAGKADDIRTLAGKGGTLDKAAFKPAIADFYLTNPIARASAVMAECSRLASGQLLTAAE